MASRSQAVSGAADKGPPYPSNADVPFMHLASMWNYCEEQAHKQKAKNKAYQALQRFMNIYINRKAEDTFAIMRLMCPEYDRTRGTYQLKEAGLTQALAKACGVLPKGPEVQELTEFHKTSTSRAQGQYHTRCYEILLRKYCDVVESDKARASQLTVGELNRLLDQLADHMRGKVEQKAETLRLIMSKCTGTMMKWIVCIILQKIKIGRSADTILKLYHKDAEDLWSLTQDLKVVCEKLRDPNSRMLRKDVEPGCAVDPMKAQAVYSVSGAIKMLDGKPFVVEVKLDGERLLLHRITKTDSISGVETEETKYTSRRGHEHGQKSDYTVLDVCVRQQVVPQNALFDGEIIVWNKARHTFEPFGTVKSAVNAAAEAREASSLLMTQGDIAARPSDPEYSHPTLNDIELLYVVFDILYSGEESHIRKPLEERHRLLREAVRDAPTEGYRLGGPTSSVFGRIVVLLPGLPFMNQPLPFSKICRAEEELQDMCDRAFNAKEEGVVVKRLDSQWQYGKRSDCWLKIKPDYLQSQDVDAVIIGGYYGSGRNAGQLHEFCLAIPKAGGTATGPDMKFESFCKVGQGLTDEGYAQLRDTLRQIGYKQAKGPSDVPPNVEVTGLEKPDVWIKDVMKSVVVQVHADIRTIYSKNFKSPISLRFPRIERVRPDKDPTQCTTAEEMQANLKRFMEQREKQRTDLDAAGQPHASKRGRAAHRSRAAQKTQTADALHRKIPVHLRPTDLSGIEVQTNALAGLKICFLAQVFGPYKKADLEAKVKKLGGALQMSLPKARDPSIRVLANSLSPLLQGEIQRGWYDIIRISWLDECQAAGQLLPVRPWNYLHMTPETRAHNARHDPHGDPWFVDVDTQGQDMSQLLNKHVDRHLLKQVQDQLAEGEKNAKRQSDAVLAAGVELGDGNLTLESLILDINEQLAEIGLARPNTSLLRGKVVYLLDMWPIWDQEGCDPITAGNPGGRAAAAGLEGLLDSAQAARSSKDKLHDLLLEELRIKVLSHGGTIQDKLAPGVTHIVVFPPGIDTLEPSELVQQARDGLTPPTVVSPSAVIHALHVKAMESARDTLAAAAQKQADKKQAKAAEKPTGLGGRGRTKKESLLKSIDSLPASLPMDLAGLPNNVLEAAAGQGADGALSEVQHLVEARAGRLMAHIRKRLLDGRIHMIHPSWVKASTDEQPHKTDSRDADGAGRPATTGQDLANQQPSKLRSDVIPEVLHPPWIWDADRPARKDSETVYLIDDRDDDAGAAPPFNVAGGEALQVAGAMNSALAGGGVVVRLPGNKGVSLMPKHGLGVPVYNRWPWYEGGLFYDDDGTCSSTDGHGGTATEASDAEPQAVPARRGRGRGRGGATQSRAGGTQRTRKKPASMDPDNEEDMGRTSTGSDSDVPKKRGASKGGRGRGRGARAARGTGTAKRGRKTQVSSDGSDGDHDDEGPTLGRRSTAARRSRPPGYKGMRGGAKRPRLAAAVEEQEQEQASEQHLDGLEDDMPQQQPMEQKQVSPQQAGVQQARPRTRKLKLADMMSDSSSPSFHLTDLDDDSDHHRQDRKPSNISQMQMEPGQRDTLANPRAHKPAAGTSSSFKPLSHVLPDVPSNRTNLRNGVGTDQTAKMEQPSSATSVDAHEGRQHARNMPSVGMGVPAPAASQSIIPATLQAPPPSQHVAQHPLTSGTQNAQAGQQKRKGLTALFDSDDEDGFGDVETTSKHTNAGNQLPSEPAPLPRHMPSQRFVPEHSHQHAIDEVGIIQGIDAVRAQHPATLNAIADVPSISSTLLSQHTADIPARNAEYGAVNMDVQSQPPTQAMERPASVQNGPRRKTRLFDSTLMGTLEPLEHVGASNLPPTSMFNASLHDGDVVMPDQAPASTAEQVPIATTLTDVNINRPAEGQPLQPTNNTIAEPVVGPVVGIQEAVAAPAASTIPIATVNLSAQPTTKKKKSFWDVDDDDF